MYSTLFEKIDREQLLRVALNLGSGGTVPPYFFQSATYISTRDSIVLGFKWDPNVAGNTTNKALLVEMDSAFAVLKGAYEIDGLYHCNDMTYNPNTNRLYIALTDAPGIGVINASTMLKEDDIRVSLGQYGLDKFCQISYDVANDKFYLGNSSALHIADGNFNVIKSVLVPTEDHSLPTGASHNDGNMTFLQGSDIVEGEFARVWSISEGTPYNKCTIKASRLEFYDFDTGAVTRFVDFPTRNRYHEAQATLIVGEKRYLIGYNWANIYVEEVTKGAYNLASSYLCADTEVTEGSNNVVTNDAVAKAIDNRIAEAIDNLMIGRLYPKANNGSLTDFALSLPAGIHAVQNLQGTTPSEFWYTMAIVVKNEAGDRCTIYALGFDDHKIYINSHLASGWRGWRCCATTAVPSMDQAAV